MVAICRDLDFILYNLCTSFHCSLYPNPAALTRFIQNSALRYINKSKCRNHAELDHMRIVGPVTNKHPRSILVLSVSYGGRHK